MNTFLKKLFTFVVLGGCLVSTFAGCGGNAENPTVSATTSGPIEKPEILYAVSEAFMGTNKANDSIFSLWNAPQREDSPLKGKTIYWLGSSVTQGACANGQSMAEYLSVMTGCICVNESLSGTTIYDDDSSDATGINSYTRRLVNSMKFDKNAKVDAFVCQISTNDAVASRRSHRGSMTDDSCRTSDAFDRSTTLGGIEFIITYVTETWGCPVYFYSGSYFGETGERSVPGLGSSYATLVEEVKQIVAKYQVLGFDVGVIDMYNDEAFNNVVSDEYFAWCMNDPVHPHAAGYLQWWTPYFESYLAYEMMKKS